MMKRCGKLPEPQSLVTYRKAQPQGTWEDMGDDPYYGGKQAYLDIKQALVKGQRCLCAYCEMKIAESADEFDIQNNKHRQRVEHFHPKEDHAGSTNWALQWSNLWVVCHGGSQRPPEGIPFDPSYFTEPLPQNLSCDAYKDHQITKGELPLNPDGWILAPNEVPAFPLVFDFFSDGSIRPHIQNCISVDLPNNNYADTTVLVENTIRHLNLSCNRLKRNRHIAWAQLEKRIRKARQLSPGLNPQMVLLGLARKLFASGADSSWPEFFSLIRHRLGVAAEAHLKTIEYEEHP